MSHIKRYLSNIKWAISKRPIQYQMSQIKRDLSNIKWAISKRPIQYQMSHIKRDLSNIKWAISKRPIQYQMSHIQRDLSNINNWSRWTEWFQQNSNWFFWIETHSRWKRWWGLYIFIYIYICIYIYMTHWYICDMTHSYLWFDTWICRQWRTSKEPFKRDPTWLFWNWNSQPVEKSLLNLYIYVYIYMTHWCICDMTHWYLGFDACICMQWLTSKEPFKRNPD